MARLENAKAVSDYLKARRTPATVDEIRQATGLKRSTAYRALSMLRDELRHPIEKDERHGGYQYGRDAKGHYEVPSLWFNAVELEALACLDAALSGLQGSLLESALEPIRARVAELMRAQSIASSAWRDRLKMIPIAHRQVDAAVLRIVAAGTLRRKQIQVSYQKPGGDAAVARRLSPQTLIRYRDNWYLDAWCHMRNALRTFSVDRIMSAELARSRAAEVPKDELLSHFTHSYGIYAGLPTATAVIRFAGTASDVVQHEEWHPEQRGNANPDGTYTLSIPYCLPDELIMDILRWGPEAEVVSPQGLRDEVRAKLDRAHRIYR